jgi:hypothetical protein
MLSDVRFPHLNPEPDRSNLTKSIATFLILTLSICAVDRFGLDLLFGLLQIGR